MSKHNRAFKLKLAKLAQSIPSREVGKRYGVASSLVRYWSQVYSINGADSFKHPHQPYSLKFKAHVLTTMTVNGWSLSYTSAHFDLSSQGILFQWHKLYAQEGLSRLTPRKNSRPNMTEHSTTLKPSAEMTEKELREELDYLRAENAVLKKLEALAQARKKKAKKRP
ncbi:transposase [Aequoribacter fuscus]|jgi:transposase|nr:transposase [Aequoribacter fuscus]QHJ87654.1 transposase [Aequoribacter fuscus]QHJ87943.1 transposase [Aequoribacter fuscus]QHJ88523.1 transposase [Aequoribacter fuscus]QHJ89179.1 transposase [Aequoribacter fuscus]